MASDRIAVAARGGFPAEALEVAAAVGLQTLPAYALTALIGAARDVPDRDVQARAVAQLALLEPGSLTVRVQRVLLDIDTGQFARARAALDAWPLGEPIESRVAVLELRAVLAEAQGDAAIALRHYQDLLVLAPTYRPALRGQVFLTSRLGSAGAALARARVDQALFSELELAGLRQAALGERLRWAVSQRDLDPGAPRRFEALDEVLREGEALSNEVASGRARAAAREVPDWTRVQVRLDADRTLGLFERARWGDTVALYAQVLTLDAMPPYWATASAAGAQARLRRPDLAVPLYEAALREGGEAIGPASDVRVGLVYALVDTGHFAEADAVLADMIARTPPLLKLSPEAGRPNDEYGDLLGLRARISLYTNRLGQAEADSAVLAALAPQHAGYRTTQARVMRAREHPDAALAVLAEVVADHPDAIDPRAAQAEVLFDAGRLREARELTDSLALARPEDASVRAAVRTRDTVMPAQFEADASTARDGGTLSNLELRLETKLTSHWIDDQWRVYWRQRLGRAEVGAQDLNIWRTGVGVEWQQGRLNLQAEVHALGSEPRPAGVRLAAGWRASDQWRLSGEYDSSTGDLPVRARLAGVAASSLEAGIGYVVNESRRIDAQFRLLSFNDGNRRDALGLTWRERWISGPVLLFDTTVSAQTGRSRTDAVPYFSPSSDSTVSVLGRAQWLSWKRDDAAFYQVVEAGIGSYGQAGYGRGAVGELRYAHEWDLNLGRRLRYGVGVSTHPYDGVDERRKEVFLHYSQPIP